MRRYDKALIFALGLACALALVIGRDAARPRAAALTQDDIDKAVLHTIETKTLPSRAAKAAELVLESVVRVEGYNGEENDEPGSGVQMQGVGSGVVIVDSGIILTNLHVVSGAKRVTVKFYDGSESDVDLVRVYPENDLAVIKARKVPDDLESATLGLDCQPQARRRGGRCRLPVRHWSVGLGRRRSRGSTAVSVLPRASRS